MLEQLVLILFVCGRSIESEYARRNLDRLVKDKLQHLGLQLEVVDISEDPDKAVIHNIIATPTLMRVLPDQQLRIIGDLSNTENVLTGLGIRAAAG